MGTSTVRSLRTAPGAGRLRFSLVASLVVAGLAALVLVAPALATPSFTWSATYDGAFGGDDRFLAMAVDSAGNAYAAGSVARPAAFGLDALLVKFSPTGQRLWARSFDGPPGQDDYATDMVRDPWGDLCLTGRVSGHGGDVLVAKYSPDGKLRWSRAYDRGYGYADTGTAIGVDAQGNIYVAASCVLGVNKTRLMVIKYDRAGNRKWARAVGAAATSTRPRDIAVNAVGGVAVCGIKSNPTTGSTTSLVALLDAAGTLKWQTGYNGQPAGRTDTVRVRWHGSYVWVLGSTHDAGAAFSRAHIARFNSLGQLKGAYGTPRTGPGYSFRDFVITGTGAYIVGQFGTPSGTDSLVLKVTLGVTYAWAAGLNIGPRESFTAIAADASGNVWAVGQAGGPMNVLGLNPACASLGSISRSAPLVTKDAVVAAVYRGGAIYVAGSTQVGSGHSDGLVARVSLQ